MDIMSEITQTPPAYEGGPKSAELLPSPDSADFDQMAGTILALVQRQTGIDLSLDRTLRVDPRVSNRMYGPESQEYANYMNRQVGLEEAANNIPLAKAPDETEIKAEIAEWDELNNSYNRLNKPDRSGLIKSDPKTFKSSLSGHRVHSVVIFGPKGKGLHLNINRIVGEEGVSGGILKIAIGNNWHVYLAKESDNDKSILMVKRNLEPIEYHRQGLPSIGKKIPKADIAKKIIGDVIDGLPQRGRINLNPEYTQFRESQYGI